MCVLVYLQTELGAGVTKLADTVTQIADNDFTETNKLVESIHKHFEAATSLMNGLRTETQDKHKELKNQHKHWETVCSATIWIPTRETDYIRNCFKVDEIKRLEREEDLQLLNTEVDILARRSKTTLGKEIAGIGPG